MTEFEFMDNRKPLLAKYVYSDMIKNFLLLYNMYGKNKFILLDKKAQKIFNLCNGKNTINEICSHSTLADRSSDDIKQTISRLIKCGVLIISDYAAGDLLEQQHSNGKNAFGVWLHMTNNCNLRCSYCYIDKSKGDMPISVAESTISNLVDQCGKYGITNLLIKFAGGEPLMVWDNLVRIVDFTKKCCDKASISPRFHVVSNGILITKSIATYLYRNRIPIGISLDGVNEINDSQRFYVGGKGSFTDIERGIKILKDVGQKPFILVTVTENNINGLQELTKYLLEYGLSFRYSFLRDCDQLSLKYLYSISEQYVEILNRCFDDIERWMLTENYNFNVKLCDVNLRRVVNRTCGVGRNSVAVNHRGEIALCQMIFDQPIGNIMRDDIIKVTRQQNIIPDLNEKNSNNSECKQCIWKNVCAGGCPIFTYQQYGKLNKSSPYCSAFKQLIPRVVRLHGIKLLREYGQLESQERR